uniref:Mitoguardin n=2 Tax=Clytia hemisphaerica TaxID=252671 RepID=A0A7M5WY72_9CNID|eukprot:TCONS_00012636-protein
MDGTGGGSFSYLLETTKSKLLVLSSLLGVGAIYYMTKNYLQNGRFFPSWYEVDRQVEGELEPPPKKRGTVIGGKGHIVIKEEIDSGGSLKPTKYHKQRSRRGSVSSRRSMKSNKSTRLAVIPGSEGRDVNLNKAIIEFDKSLIEVESLLNFKNEYNRTNHRSNEVIEEGIERLRKLLNYSQDLSLIQTQTTEYLDKQIQTQTLDDELLQICDAQALEGTNYNDVLDTVYNNRFGEVDSDYDSDNDSFASAAESVDLEVTEEEVQDYVTFQKKLKDLISKYNQEDFLMYGIEYLTNYGVPIRSVRTELVHCENDVDFSVKVFCLRRAFKHMLKNSECKEWFVKSGKEMLTTLLKKANYDHMQFGIDYDEMVRYCEDSQNWAFIDEELGQRGVCSMNFYDVILDFMIMDSLEDLQNPPSSVTAAIQNRWLSQSIKKTALSTAIWTVIQSKKRMLQNPDGFYSRFYDVSMHLTPLLAWGFLGPVKELNDVCFSFKDSMLGFMKDIFSSQTVSYKSMQTLAEDIFRVANERKDQLLTALS